MLKKIKRWYQARKARRVLCNHLKLPHDISDHRLMFLAIHMATWDGDYTAGKLLDDWAAKRNWRKPLKV